MPEALTLEEDVLADGIQLGQKYNYSELVIGLVGPIGTDLDTVVKILEDRLENHAKYECSMVKVSKDIIPGSESISKKANGDQ